MTKILGVSGSPRKCANTSEMVRVALAAAATVPGIETELYECAGKKIRPCTDCGACLKKGACTVKDDLADFVHLYDSADGVIWAAPVYCMGIPASMKALFDRMNNSEICRHIGMGEPMARPMKASGVLAVGGARNGGQELTLSYLVTVSLMARNIVVAGDADAGAYIGASGWSGVDGTIDDKKAVVQDLRGLDRARGVGKRVAELAMIMSAGKEAVRSDLPPEYFLQYGGLRTELACK